MPLNTSLKLPSNLTWLVLTQLLLAFGGISLLLALIGGRAIGFGFFMFFAIVIVLPIWMYELIAFKYVSFSVAEGMVTIDSGIIFKHSNSISFAQVQNVTNTRGPIASSFGLSKVSIWTASPEQIRIQKNDTEHRPTGVLWLETAHAEWIKKFILEKKS